MGSTNTIITVLKKELCVSKKEVTEKSHCSNKTGDEGWKSSESTQMLLKRLLCEEQYTDKTNGEVGTFHCSVQTNSRQKGKGEMSERILLTENTALSGNKGTCNIKKKRLFGFIRQWYMLPMKWQSCCYLSNSFTGITHSIWGWAGDIQN